VYTPEEGINIKMLARDIDHLRESFANDHGQGRAGKLILRNERASKTYTTEMIANMIREEANTRFESRFAIPGHVQQGGAPSPMDRVRAVRLAVKCMQFLEQEGQTEAAVIGIKGSKVVFSPMEVVERDDTDWAERRPKQEFWMALRETVDTLSGRFRPPTGDQNPHDAM
jgi:6-phosphofructokinase 1